MTAPGNDLLLSGLLLVFLTSTGYAAGRLHQWYRTALERDQAYRDGYDTATRSLFGLAARLVRPRSGGRVVQGTATVTPILAASGRADHPAATTSPARATTAAADAAADNAGGIAAAGNVGGIAAGGNAGGIAVARNAGGNAVARNAGGIAAAGKAANAAAGKVANAAAGKAVEIDGAAADAVRSGSRRRGRHTAVEDRMETATYRLSADRVARARIPEQPTAGHRHAEPPHLVVVPQERVS